MRTLFLHGAGGFTEDRPLADALGIAGAHASMPRMSDEDMSVASWSATIRPHLAELGRDDLVVGHSFGGSILLLMLAAEPWPAFDVHLLAMPNWGPQGWAVADYEYTGPEPQHALTLHHCADDDVVPFAHLALNSAVLPHARAVPHPGGGHQFDGRSDALRGAFHTRT